MGFRSDLPLKLSSKKKGIFPFFFIEEGFKIFIASSVPKSELFSSFG